jgi:hypothetical protein
MGVFALAASLLAGVVLSAALWMGNHEPAARVAESELFGEMPAFVATVQP